MYHAESIAGTQTIHATCGSIRIAVKLVHYFCVHQENLRVAECNEVDTCTNLFCTTQGSLAPFLAHLTDIPLTAVDTEWWVLVECLFHYTISLLQGVRSTGYVTTLVLVVVWPEERSSHLNLTRWVPLLTVAWRRAIDANTDGIA